MFSEAALFFANIKKYYRYAVRSAKAELKSEVADSRLNWLWWIIEPLSFMAIYTFVFGVVFQSNRLYFAPFVCTGTTVWSFFSRMATGSVRLIASSGGLVTKVYLPKYILLLSKSFTYLFKMLISLAIVFCFMLFQRVPLSWHIVFIIPIFAVLYVLSFGFGCFLMHFGVLLTDLANLTDIALRMVFYLSGVFYDINARLSGTLALVLSRANPVAFIMNEARGALLENRPPDFAWLALWLAAGVMLTAAGVHIIHKNENSYAKLI